MLGAVIGGGFSMVAGMMGQKAAKAERKKQLMKEIGFN